MTFEERKQQLIKKLLTLYEWRQFKTQKHPDLFTIREVQASQTSNYRKWCFVGEKEDSTKVYVKLDEIMEPVEINRLFYEYFWKYES